MHSTTPLETENQNLKARAERLQTQLERLINRETDSDEIRRSMLGLQIKDLNNERDYWKTVARGLVRVYLVDDQAFDIGEETDRIMATYAADFYKTEQAMTIADNFYKTQRERT